MRKLMYHMDKIIYQNCTHLSNSEQDILVKLLLDFKDIFDATLDYW